MFKTIKNDSTSEIVEKKSRFIGNLFYVETVQEAEEKIKEINKKYFDARHNCYAFSVRTENGIVNRFSDNGEPNGTAGGPMLNILNTQGITNCLIIVTRYFGGILLGTGGLVRAYSETFKKALENTQIIEKELGLEASIFISYSDLQKIQYHFSKQDIKIIDTKYNENIEVIIETTEEKYNKLLESISKKEVYFEVKNIQINKKKYIEI